jgi:hypothetical protein
MLRSIEWRNALVEECPILMAIDSYRSGRLATWVNGRLRLSGKHDLETEELVEASSRHLNHIDRCVRQWIIVSQAQSRLERDVLGSLRPERHSKSIYVVQIDVHPMLLLLDMLKLGWERAYHYKWHTDIPNTKMRNNHVLRTEKDEIST